MCESRGDKITDWKAGVPRARATSLGPGLLLATVVLGPHNFVIYLISSVSLITSDR
jgi:hypothetical protein